jgi:iron(III) transport system ATP-binding protein
MLELTAISKSFADVQVLDSLNLSVRRGAERRLSGRRGQENHAAAYSCRV